MGGQSGRPRKAQVRGPSERTKGEAQVGGQSERPCERP